MLGHTHFYATQVPNLRQNKTRRDETGRDGTGRDGTGRDETRRDETRRDGTGRDGTGRDETRRDGTGRDGTGREGRDGTGRDGTGRDGTGRDETRRDETRRDGTGRDGTGRNGTGRDEIKYVLCLSLGAAADLMFATHQFMDEYYIKPYCRAAPYFLGLLTGYVLHRNRCELELTKTFHTVSSAIATACCLAVIFGTTGFASDDASQSTSSFYISMNHVAFAYIGNVVLSYACAFLLHIGFEAPMMALERTVFKQ
nr:hypothetical protein BaRGS_035347 [Batillaria attramentaria]